MRTSVSLLFGFWVLWGLFQSATAEENIQSHRGIPATQAGNPGNIFLRGETVAIDLPEKKDWILYNYDGRAMRRLRSASRAVFHGLPVGFYRLRASEIGDWVSFAVLEPLKAPTPETSPVSLDVAMAWLYPVPKMDQVANLCALAGANWVRDRIHWPEMEPRRGHFAGPNRHDHAAEVQKRHNFQTLTVFASSPEWANPIQRRFPLDLRDAYRFAKSVAERWKGQITAFEPWNEAEFRRFGGHTGAEIATYQKAAFFGLKSGNSNGIACLIPFVMENRSVLTDLGDNVVWPYFDTYNIHHYSLPEELPGVFAQHRPITAGRPIWVTEAGLLQEWTEFPGSSKEFSDDSLRIQAEYVAKLIAASLFEGCVNIFYYTLPHYSELEILCGLLRPDLTPRPAFVAFAAVGRLLSDARAVGRLRSSDNSVSGFLFSAKPDGVARQVLVAWTTNKTARLELKQAPEQVLDMFGRRKQRRSSLRLSREPTFVILSPHKPYALDTCPPPFSGAAVLPPERSPVVMQAIWPEEMVNLEESAYLIRPGQEEKIPLWIYNFAEEELKGRLQVEAPDQWKVDLETELNLEPMCRIPATLTLRAAPSVSNSVERLRIIGSFNRGGKSLLSIRLLPSSPDAGAVQD